MTINEIKEYIKEELEIQKEIAYYDGQRFNKQFRDDIKIATLNCLHLDGKITDEQYSKMLKHYKLED